MTENVYFDGDPATDSARRHMERVLKGGPPRRRWWVVALLAGGGAWAAWRVLHRHPAGEKGAAPLGQDANDRAE